ncbi:arginase family protein, partial [Paenibacillus sp. 7516]|uniref:arginase family protein n=1 Tax=Paenibacillus sp. 7516 TaxID=2022549 RepID=UPI000BDC38A5
FDVIDPVQFNSTGFLVPFGLQIEQILSYIEKLKQFNIIGIDLMEFNSSLDTQKKDQYICTNILKKCIEVIGGV